MMSEHAMYVTCHKYVCVLMTSSHMHVSHATTTYTYVLVISSCLLLSTLHKHYTQLDHMLTKSICMYVHVPMNLHVYI